jgi:predicted nucleic-acid-binding protein
VIVDTNVLLRLIDGGTGAHARAARQRVVEARKTGAKLAVLSSTVLEVGYVLESSAAGYGWNRDAVAEAVNAIVDEPAFAVEHGSALRTAVAIYRNRAVDLHDCLLSALAEERDTLVLSFDADLRRLGTSERP